MKFDDHFLEELRQATDIVEVISPYVTLRKKGQNWFGLCPFHQENTPSFSVHQGRGMYYCFGCGAGGNAITFLMEHDGMTFGQAVEDLARRAGIPLPRRSEQPAQRGIDRLRQVTEEATRYFEQQLRQPAGQAAVTYLKKRGITGTTAKAFRLGMAPDAWDELKQHLAGRGFTATELQEAGLIKPRERGGGHYDTFRNRLIFPFIDRRGRVIGFGGRNLDPDDSSGPKYFNSPETPLYRKGRVLYGLHQAVPALIKNQQALLVEGQFDVITLHQAGQRGAVAASGTAFTQEQAHLLRQLVNRVVLLFDADDAGLKATWRSYESLVREGLEVRFVRMPVGTDPDALVRAEGAEAFAGRVEGALTVVPFFLDNVHPPLEELGAAEKAEVARALVNLLRHDPDELRLDLHLQQAAGPLGLEVPLLRREADRLSRQGAHEQSRTARSTDSDTALPAGEAALLQRVLTDAPFRERMLARLQPDDFEDPRLRAVFNRLTRLAETGKPIAPDRLLEQSEGRERGIIAGLLSRPGPTDEGPGEELLQGVERRRRRERKKQLRASIEQARLAGDEVALAQLLKEYQEMHL